MAMRIFSVFCFLFLFFYFSLFYSSGCLENWEGEGVGRALWRLLREIVLGLVSCVWGGPKAIVSLIFIHDLGSDV